jgi:Hydrazine synthase alpha subunit middle domain
MDAAYRKSIATASELSPSQPPKVSIRTPNSAWLICVAVLLAACGGGDPSSDKITLSTGQSGASGNDPANVDYPVFYVKRPVPDPNAKPAPQPSNVLKIRVFEPGADLFMRSSASPSAQEVNLTTALTKDLGDVRDVDVSFDGKKVVFAMRFPFKAKAKEKDLPKWNIWEYDIASSSLRRVIPDDSVAEQGNDRFPHYLPDGRIIFSSTRQKTAQSVLLDENKEQYQGQDENNNEPASVLHVMKANGDDIHQVSFNQSHDLDSAVLPNGQIIFSRWDGATGNDHVDLYRMNPDGSDMELLYGKQPTTHASGNNSTNTNDTVIQFLSPRPLASGLIMSVVRPMTGTEDGGDLITIDTNTYVENTQATVPNAGMKGPAQQRLTPALAIYTDPGLSAGGRFRSVFPLDDGSNRLLVSWNPCRLDEDGVILPCSSRPNAVITPTPMDGDPPPTGPIIKAAPPIYSIWIYNPTDGTQLPIVAPTEGIIMSDVVAAAPRKIPPVILDRVDGVDFATELQSQAAGIINIKSVYDYDGNDTATGGIVAMRNPATTTAAQRPARFLRIEKAVSLPSKDVRDIKGSSFGPAGRFMREILGYAPIEPDGSVRVKVPANVAFQLTIVDANTRRISPLHSSWLQLRPGQVLSCNGCHNDPSKPAPQPPAIALSHGRSDLFRPANPGAPASGQFPNSNSILLGSPGQTMAETRASMMCQLTLGMSACSPSVDVIFDDFWTDPVAAGHAKDASFDYCYSNSAQTDLGSDPADPTMKHQCGVGLATPIPTQSACEKNWTGNCRIVINYERNIQPIWELDRGPKAAPTDPKGAYTCTGCHSPVDAASAARVPAGQLDLSPDPDTDQPDHFTSYERLLSSHNAQELFGTMLRDICLVPQLDNNGNVIGCDNFQVVNAPMAALNARGSRFFTAVKDATHAGFMTDAELRLISEWLDIGAQYYNDPFLAPVN